jgi:hypothetical protein
MPAPDRLRPILDQLGSGATVAMAETVHQLLEQARTGAPTPPIAEVFNPGATYLVRDTAGELDAEDRADYLSDVHERVGCTFVVVGPEVEVSAATLGAANLSSLAAAHAELAELRRKARYADVYLEENDELRAELARIRDGADPTPPLAGAVLAPGQLWHRLITATPDDRADLIGRLLAASGVAAHCVAADHAGVLDQLSQTMGALAVERTTRAAAVQTLRDALAVATSEIDNLIAERRGNIDANSPAEIERRRIRAFLADLLDPPQNGAPS